MSARDCDLLVIGAGATGLAAARTASSAGRRVVVVEAARPGGDCTHYGCVPSKTLLDVAHRASAAREGRRLGVGEMGKVDFPAVMRHVHDVIDRIEQDESPELLRREGIDLLTGWARFVEVSERGTTVDVDGTRVRAARVVIASGANAAVPPVEGLADVPYLTNATVFGLTEQPQHLLVMGGGAIGVELAQAFAGLGTNVTLVEGAPRLLGKEEPQAAAVMAGVLTRQGVDVRTGSQVASVRRGPGGGVVLTLDEGSEVAGSHLLVAVGRRPATAGMDLDRVDIETGQGGAVVTDEQLRTSAPGVWAAGDCTTPLQFTHVGDAQGRLAAHNAFARSSRLPELLGGPGRFDPRVVPWVTFTAPEVGRVGLTEAEAFERYGARARVAVVTMAETDRSRTQSATDGYVKLVAGPRRLAPHRLLDEVVGMTAVSPHAGELAHTAALAMRTRMLAARLAQTVAPYPTYSLALRIAAARLFSTFAGQTWRPARASEDGENA
ncbi:dihydrolipoyl dehydrogenase family protein [Aquipuribacter nitratireducens]|uniref:Dihydrolipoyl dehydrogenase family protein n=1 Tax=Aquipuribacter nitratireducens TaxID=650104 RepID=A0ABW0GR83_9MICO